MHVKPTLHDWSVSVVDDTAVFIAINDDLSIESTKLKILGKDRNLLIELVPTNRAITIDVSTIMPIFVELHTPHGVSVQYALGSGADFYKN